MRALVIGPGGLGSAISSALLDAGHDVVVGYHHDRSAVGELGVPAHQVDVTDPDSCKRFIAEVWRENGPCQAIVNCFGTVLEAPLLRSEPKELEQLLALNVLGVHHVCQAAAFRLMKCRGATIVNVGSAVSRTGMPGLAGYAASKGALVSLGRSLAVELGPYGVTCNTVLPGFVDAGATAQRDQRWKDEVGTHIPLGRLGTAADVAGVVCALVSPALRYVTGQEIVVDGGWSLGTARLAKELVELSRG